VKKKKGGKQKKKKRNTKEAMGKEEKYHWGQTYARLANENTLFFPASGKEGLVQIKPQYARKNLKEKKPWGREGRKPNGGRIKEKKRGGRSHRITAG